MKWHSIPGYEGQFEITEDGQVRSLPHERRPGKARILRPHINMCGYFQITFQRNLKKTYPVIHRLIALTFIPNPHNLPEVNHKNGDKTDNRIENLEWMTHKENINHAVDTGLMSIRYGENAGHRKMDNEKVILIRKRFSEGVIQKQIAEEMGVTKTCIRDIVIRKTWKHI